MLKNLIYKQYVRDFAWTSSRNLFGIHADNRWTKRSCAWVSMEKKHMACTVLFSTKRLHIPLDVFTFTILSLPFSTECGSINGYGIPDYMFQLCRKRKDGSYCNQLVWMIEWSFMRWDIFFPMISTVMSVSGLDGRSLNTFCRIVSPEELWDNKFPSRRGPAFQITDYMKLPKDQFRAD